MAKIKGYSITVSNEFNKDQLAFGNDYTEFYRNKKQAEDRVVGLQEDAEGEDKFEIKPATLDC